MSCRLLARLSLLTSLFLLGSQQVMAGTWRLATGGFIVGDFVSLQITQVQLKVYTARCEEKILPVPLEQFSSSDQFMIRALAKLQPAPKQVEGSGIGSTPDEARHAAIHDAAERASTWASSKTVIRNDVLDTKKSFDLTFSEGFVKEYKVLDQHREGNDFRCTISAIVQTRDLPLEPPSRTGKVDAGSVFAEAEGKVLRRIGGMAIIQKAINGFAPRLLDTQFSVGSVQLIPGDNEHFDLPYTVTITTNQKRYDDLRQQLIMALEALSKYSGSVAANSRMFSDQPQLSSEQIQRKSFDNMLSKYFFSASNGEHTQTSFGRIELFDDWQVTGNLPVPMGPRLFSYKPQYPSTMLMINVPSEDTRRSYWRWFEIEEQPQIPGIKLDLVLRCRNKGRVRHRATILSIGPSFPGISLAEPSENLQTAIIGPFFVHHRGSGYRLADRLFPFARSLTVQGTTRLSMEDKDLVKTIDVVVRGHRVVETPAPNPPKNEEPPHVAEQPAPPGNAEMRKWTRKNGKQFEAVFVKAEKNTDGKFVITLRQPNGSEMTVHPPGLSDDDRKYVRERLKDPGKAQPKEDNDQKPADATWRMAGEYPLIAGKWAEWEEGGIFVTIQQTNGKFVTNCTYNNDQGVEVHWRAIGTISKDGEITANLDHTKPEGYASQVRTGKLDLDGNTIHGHANWDGGEHDFAWTLKEPHDAAPKHHKGKKHPKSKDSPAG